AVNEKDIYKVVLSYLVHNCFKDTVDSFITCTGLKQPTGHLEDMEKRKRIFHFAMDGNALKAIELTAEFAPGLLEENKDLHFDLLSLHFVELVCSRSWFKFTGSAEALGFAQTKLTPFGKEQKYVEKLEDFMALLAYEEPEKSPMFHLLSMDYRQRVADCLNRTILGWAAILLFEGLPQELAIVKSSRNRDKRQISGALLEYVLMSCYGNMLSTMARYWSIEFGYSQTEYRKLDTSAIEESSADRLLVYPLSDEAEDKMLTWTPQQYSLLNFSDRSLWASVSSVSLQPFLFSRSRHFPRKSTVQKKYQCAVLKNVLIKTKSPPSPSQETLVKERHKYFDEVIISVRAGDGGHGSILSVPNHKATSKSQRTFGKDKTKKRDSYKRDFDGSLILPVGGHGGDVVIYADESIDTLLEFHKNIRYNAKRGGNVDSMGVLSSQLHNGLAAPTLRIPVPLGTVVKNKRGKLLADLTHPGDEVVAARGGQGGISLLEAPEHKKKKLMTLSGNIMRDDSDKVLVLGQPGEEVTLQLILRIVADVGLVGLPNAGKSTLLAAITLAKPDIADYPFTTLMPNLGRLDGDPSLGAGQFSSEATLADLPGLIEGAHLGKGLGRNFLRHLRRTRMLVHVVDAAAEDPIRDYRTVKEELRMYNPDYLERPHIVVLNKIDKPEAMERLPYLKEEIKRIGRDKIDLQSHTCVETADSPISTGEETVKDIDEYPRPLSVVGVSVLKGVKVNEMLKEIRAALQKCRDSSESEQIQASPS
ncbi:hypothetical protein F511_25335, partial [Dorcoceras hygrometricum]